MIALGLLILFGLYIALLVAAWRMPRSRWGRFIAVAVVLSPVIWKTWDMPVGHYRFRQACEAEAGVKVYEPNPAPAKRVRMEDMSYAESTLKRYPSLAQIEARDQQYGYVTPTAYAVYERLSDGTIVATLMDKVGQINGMGETKLLESAPSQAEYVISETLEYFPYRLHKRKHVLRHTDGRLVATVTYYGYTDTDPYKSLFGATWGRGEACGPGRDEIDILLSFITSER